MAPTKIAIIQARMSSSRLPGKVLLDIAGRPMLEHMLARTMRAKAIDAIVVATTTDPTDDVLEQFCHSKGVPCYRGNLPDVLDRFYRAATHYQADVIIRLTADCPLIDPELIDLTVTSFLGNPLPLETHHSSPIPEQYMRINPPIDFLANRLPPPWKRSLPIGLDVEVCSSAALERAWKEADQTYQREHVLPYLYEGIAFTTSPVIVGMEWYIEQNFSPRGFHVGLINHNPDFGSLRWTVDTPADLEFVRRVVAHFGPFAAFGWQEVLDLLEQEPDLASINAVVKHKTAFDVDQRTPHA